MLFPRPVIHGIYVLCYLSRQKPNVVVPAKEAASKMAVPPEQASKILQSLASAGLVEAHRGRLGGYSLAKPLDEITLADVCTAISDSDGQDRLQARTCPEAPTENCSAYAGLMRMHTCFWDVMRRETLASLLGEPCKSDRVPLGQPPSADRD